MTELFIIGPPKTGTTLTTRLLYQHPDILGLSESFILMPDHPHSICQPLKAEAHGLGPDDARVLGEHIREGDYRTAMCEAWSRMEFMPTDAKVLADSWPLYGIHLKTVHAAFPGAYYLHTVRHPCAVYWSGQTFIDPNTRRPREAGSLSLYDMIKVDRIVRESKTIDNRVQIVRYEDVVCETERTIRSLWRWLGVSSKAGWIEYDPARDPWPGRWSWVPNSTKTPNPARLERWKHQMDEETYARISRHPDVREFCERYGYQLHR